MAEPLTLRIESDTPRVTWPDWAEALPGWDVVPQTVTERSATLTLRSWLPGEIAIPAITATTPGGVTFTTAPRTVAVASVLPDDADVADAATLRDAAGALAVDGASRRTAARWAAGAAGGLLLVVAAAAVWRRGRRRRAAPERALDGRLAAAKAGNDPHGATDAVRRYVDERLGLNVRAMTAADLAADTAASTPLGGRLHTVLIELLRSDEAARFAAAGDPADVVAAAQKAAAVARERVRERGGQRA